MGLSLSDQGAYFLWSIAFGAGLGLLYDLLRAARRLLRPKKTGVMISDILFFAVCGVLTSLFALPFNKGGVRAFIVFGEAVGFLCWRLTLGEAAGRVWGAVASIVRKILRKICELLKNFFDLLLKTGAFVVYNVSEIKAKLLNVVFVGLKEKHRDRKRQKARNRRKEPEKGAKTSEKHKKQPLLQQKSDVRRTKNGRKNKKETQKHRQKTEKG